MATSKETDQSSTDDIPPHQITQPQKTDVEEEKREFAVSETKNIDAEALSGSDGGHPQPPPGFVGRVSHIRVFNTSLPRFMSLLGMAFLWTGSQLPPYLWGGIPPIVYSKIGGSDRWTWFITGNLLCSAAVCPFVGAFSDLVGRRYAVIVGCIFLVVGQIICACANNMNVFIAGQCISGVGAGVGELIALAGTAELVSTAKRGVYIAMLILSIFPFIPSVMWSQLIAANSTWRNVGVLTAVYNFVGLLIMLVFYHPPPRSNSVGMRWRELSPRIDFLGGFLSISGVVLLVAGLFWGGYPYKWSSAHVLGPLLIGAFLLILFAFWELFGAKYPMVPKGLARKGEHYKPWTLAMALIVTFVSGANFFSVLMLWPSQAHNVYGHDPVGIGLRGLPFAIGVLIGCVVSLLLLVKCRGGNRWMLFVSSAIMTAGCGGMASATRDNLAPVYVLLFIAGIGVGGIVVPASMVAMIICPDELIATSTSLTLAVRVMGGAVGYAIYYNVLVQKIKPQLISYIGEAFERTVKEQGITFQGNDGGTLLYQMVVLTSRSQLDQIAELPGVGGKDSPLYHAVVRAGQVAYSKGYPYVYYASIGFGVVSMVASLFMEDIGPYLDDTVAVVMG